VVGDSSFKVCYFGTYRANYSRNQMMVAGLRLNGIEVVECHETLWHGIEDRIQITSGGWLKPSFWWRTLSVYWRLLRRYSQIGNYDLLMVGYPGQFDIFLARLLAWFKHKPLVWDVFMSIYLVSLERNLEEKSCFSVKMLNLIEGLALRLPDMLILDTYEYARWFHEKYGIKPERFNLVPTGADDRIFSPLTYQLANDGKFHVLYYGSFIPNHGIMYIVDAARLLLGETAIQFEFIGNGPEQEKARLLAKQNLLNNIAFIDWLEKDELTKRIARADVCLGAFGTTPQSLMTVQNKIYEALAMRKPLISGDSPAVQQVFKHGEHIYLCQRASGESLAEAILVLWHDPALREHLAHNGYRLFKEQYDLLNNGKRCVAYLRELVE
jgi:glycosyltransferase involved in cell wall biosynthesis